MLMLRMLLLLLMLPLMLMLMLMLTLSALLQKPPSFSLYQSSDTSLDRPKLKDINSFGATARVYVPLCGCCVVCVRVRAMQAEIQNALAVADDASALQVWSGS